MNSLYLGYRQQINAIKKDVGMIAYKLSYGVAKIAREELIQIHSLLVNSFYSEYSPSSYVRGRQLAHTIDPKNISKFGEKRYQASVDVKPHGSYRHNENDVFDLIWNKGNRGLPPYGSSPLQKSYVFAGHRFEQGQIWVNPYWGDEYGSTYNVTAKLNSVSVSANTLDKAMLQFVDNWWTNFDIACDKVASSIK